jgi:hypothetical protein
MTLRIGNRAGYILRQDTYHALTTLRRAGKETRRSQQASGLALARKPGNNAVPGSLTTNERLDIWWDHGTLLCRHNSDEGSDDGV